MTGPYPPPPPPGYGYPGQPPNYGPPPDSYLVWAILTTIFCCLPLGIVAIVKSSQVNSLWFQGFHDQARQSAEEAKKWAMWSAISSGILLLLYVIFIVVMLVIVGTSIGELTP